mmetsp:Transcript_10761/g.8031  ORF Transcript_10761/g.8031 Transcript_10761/m.8031 type:complete len:214 (-) Transcript_10761:276-917(-)
MEELLKNLAKEHMLWAEQAQEILYLFKNIEQFVAIFPYLLNRIEDRHNRFSLFSHFPGSQERIVNKVALRMGDAFGFCFWNPTGHYSLNLAHDVERDIAVTLILKNKEIYKLVTAGGKADRSKRGNKSCFRNETMNGMPIAIEQDWNLPTNGVLAFDFVDLHERQPKQAVISMKEMYSLLSWFKLKYENQKVSPSELVLAFSCASELLTFTSD